MTGDEDSEVVLNNNSSSCTQISSNSTAQKTQQVRKTDSGSNGSSLSSDEGRQVGGGAQGRSTELVSEVSSVSGEPLTSLGHPSKNSVFSENDADIISTTALSNSPSVDSNSEVFISGASTSTSALCGNGEPSLGVHGDNVGTPTGQSQLSDAQNQDDPDHVTLSESDLASANLDQMVQVYHQLQNYIQKLKGENQGLKESEDKLRLQHSEASRRENILVMRLATKDQELQDYAAQINELKNSMSPSSSSLKNSLLDPAVNFIIQKMKRELTETKKKLEDTQNDLNAWKFTADSNTGKRLMAKCRMLYQENEDLGRMITSGRLAKLESDLALQKSLTEEMKKAQSEMDDLVLELDEDVEGMQSTILFLQQQLREKISSSVANSSSSQSSEHLVAVNTSELCAQCRAAQEKKHMLNHTNRSLSSSEDKLVKMEVGESALVVDEDNCRTQDSINSSENERTFQNGEYSPTRDEQIDQTCKRTTRAARHFSKQTQSVNLINAESTCTPTSAATPENSSGSANNNSSNSSSKLGLTTINTTTDLTVQNSQCNANAFDGNTSSGKLNNSKSATATTTSSPAHDLNDKESEEDDITDSENTVKPPSAKRTKLSGNNNRSTSSNSSGDIGQLQNASASDEVRTVPTSSRNRNGAVDHA